MRAPLLIPVVAALAGVSVRAAAQWTELDKRLRSIEQGYEDLSPQAESFRIFPVDMRTPYGFAGLYEIVDSPGLLARRSGAVTAVFERSVYEADSTVAIPPGTVFYVGDLPVDLGLPGVLSPGGVGRVRERAWNFIDGTADEAVNGRVVGQRVDLRVPAEWPDSAAPEARPTAIWGGEARGRRVGEIVRGVAWKVHEAQASDAGDEPAQGGEGDLDGAPGTPEGDGSDR